MPKKLSGRGSYWRDPARAAQARQAMRDTWSSRRYFLVVCGGKTLGRVDRLEDVAKFVHRSVSTVHVYLARGKGTASFNHNGESITITRIYRGS